MTDGGQPFVVVGVDQSSASAAALAWAVGQAERTRARVRAVAAVEAPPLVAGGPEIAAGAMAQGLADPEQLTEAAQRWLTDAISALPAQTGAVVERQVVHGDAATALLEAATGAELLVLGNHGRGALSGALAGSVALRCAHHAGCPLVLVPAPENAAGP
ncbi:MAG TPA: universal stress protein [Pseudonocardia sp.]|nr:universal stress protein [Pseudonocardia sp.]